VSSHDFGLPKEHADFWHRLQRKHPFEKHHTLLIDDSLAVLNSAREYGIVHLVSISRPDSGMPKKEIVEFPAIADFRELMRGL
jgi:FMN phosphatase YigB (HAD superfamily)